MRCAQCFSLFTDLACQFIRYMGPKIKFEEAEYDPLGSMKRRHDVWFEWSFSDFSLEFILLLLIPLTFPYLVYKRVYQVLKSWLTLIPLTLLQVLRNSGESHYKVSTTLMLLLWLLTIAAAVYTFIQQGTLTLAPSSADIRLHRCCIAISPTSPRYMHDTSCGTVRLYYIEAVRH